MNALTRRAQAVLNDTSIDPQSRAIIRYAMETHDPWLARLVRRADAGEALVDNLDFEETPETNNDDDNNEEKIEALTEIICRAGDEPETKAAALLVLMATVENPRIRKHSRTQSSTLPSLGAASWTYSAWSTLRLL